MQETRLPVTLRADENIFTYFTSVFRARIKRLHVHDNGEYFTCSSGVFLEDPSTVTLNQI